MFSQTDAAEQEDIGFRPGGLSSFRTDEFSFTRASLSRVGQQGGLSVKLKSVDRQDGLRLSHRGRTAASLMC